MDSLTKSKSRAHSRLASLGRIRSRGSIHNTAAAHQSRVAADAELPPSLHQPQDETVSLLAKPTHTGLAAPPVSPSDAGSHHKASDTSTLSNSSSETTLSDDKSDDKSDDIKSLEEVEIPTSTRTHASKNLMHTDFAISLAIEKVVVVVVVTIRDGSFGSGMRFDCENLREPRFVIASSAVNVCSILENRTR